MALLAPVFLAYSFGAILCAYIAKKKKLNTHWALFAGLLFGIFATAYYVFRKSATGKREVKDSLVYIIVHLIFIVVFSLGYDFLT